MGHHQLTAGDGHRVRGGIGVDAIAHLLLECATDQRFRVVHQGSDRASALAELCRGGTMSRVQRGEVEDARCGHVAHAKVPNVSGLIDVDLL